MIHGYHVILTMYGFWLPNDPRGSWSEFVRQWELARIGRATKSLDREMSAMLSETDRQRRAKSQAALAFPPVSLDGHQALAIGHGFAMQIEKSGYTVWACSILPEHTHLVIARHSFHVEQIINLMKGSATREIIRERQHPLADYAESGESPPRMWAKGGWKVYLDSEEAIETAINYVEENPVKEGKPRQSWSFVTPFGGLPQGGWVTYH